MENYIISNKTKTKISFTYKDQRYTIKSKESITLSNLNYEDIFKILKKDLVVEKAL